MSDIKSLGYIKVQTNDIDRWRTFAFDVLGFAKGAGPDASALYLRMDERAARMPCARVDDATATQFSRDLHFDPVGNAASFPGGGCTQ